MAGVYPYFAVSLILLLVLTETVTLRVNTVPELSITLNFIFFGIELLPRGKNKEEDKDREERPRRTSLYLAAYRTLPRLIDTVHVEIGRPPFFGKGADPMKSAIRHGLVYALLSPLTALFSKSIVPRPVQEDGEDTDPAVLYARIPLYRFIYLVLYFLHYYRKYERRRDKWQKPK